MAKLAKRKKNAAKTVFSVSVFMVSALAVLAGCSSGKPAAPGGSGGGGGNAAAAPNTDSAASKAPLELQMTLRLFEQVPDMTNPFWTEYQKRTNTKLNIEWIPDADYTTKFNLILSSGNLPEVLAMNNFQSTPMINAIKNGAFWDLTPLLGDFSKYPNLKNNSVPDAYLNSKVLGKNYIIPQNRPQLQGPPKIRKDWLDKLGLPMPQTLDEYRTDLKKIVDADLDGSGKKDTIGVVFKGDLLDGGTSGTGGLGDAFGADKPTYDKDGGLMYDHLTPQYTDMINYLRQLYSDGTLAKDFSVIKPKQAEELFTSGKAASYVNESIRWDYPFTQTLKKVEPDADVETVPPLKGPDGYAIRNSTGLQGGFLISKKVPEAKVLQILDYFNKTTTKDYYDFMTLGIEGRDYNVVNGSPVLTPLHDKEVGSTNPWQPLPLYYDKFGKVVNPVAPKEYNDNKSKEIESEGYFTKGAMNPFLVIHSDTWTQIWPKYTQEWESMAVKAVVGQISMDDYKAYVDKLNANPDFNKAYKEFAQSYKEFFGK